MAEVIDYSGQITGDINTKMKDLEEKQRILHDRMLLIGENLIDIKDRTNSKMLEMKKDIETLKQKIDRISSFIETISGEFSKFARREDIEILAKQMKMFQPYARESKKT